MPHMAPMNWVTLFITFSLTFIVFNSMNYFTLSYQPKFKKIKEAKIKLNWKW
uniref:ATP synthase complex subunit 8 n=1 Tax=Byrrhinus sp. BYR01 TaxID=1205541 RepID=A0A0S2MRG8_9COLE|nr:ATP synthase F0 subunit 8 [Byrrhinus sp. BYR01]